MLLAALIWRYQGLPQPGPTMELSDGSTLRVAEIRWTQNYQYEHIPGSDWYGVLVRLVPQRLREWTGWKPVKGNLTGVSRGGTNLFLTTVLRRSNGSGSVDPRRLRVQDDSGRAIVVIPEDYLAQDGEVVRLWRLPALPRDTRDLDLVFLYEFPEGLWSTTPSFVVGNPIPDRRTRHALHEARSVPTLPLVASDRDFEVELFDARVVPWAENDPRLGLQLQFETRHHGLRVDFWRPENCQLIDPVTGTNDLPGQQLVSAATNTTYRTYVAPWMNEPCRVRLEFSQTDNFREDQLWTTARLNLPQSGPLHPTDAIWDREGARLELMSISPPGATAASPFPDRVNDWTGQPGFFTGWLRLSGDLPDTRLTLVRVVDQQGRALESSQARWNASEYAIGFLPVTGSTSVRLTFALHASRFVEFDVLPRGTTEAPR